MKPILSTRKLARVLHIPLQELHELAENIGQHYSSWNNTDERTGKVRPICSPDPKLKALQKRIAKDVIVGTHTFADGVHGGIKGRSARSNAEQHLRQPCLVTIDVRQFFPSVRHDQVYKLFRTEVGCGRDVARLLTRLVTLDDSLPQGAPTSVAVANLLLDSALDAPITERAAVTDTTYTRFIDDVGLSGLNPQQLIQEVAQRLSRRGLSVHRLDRRPNAKSKLKIQPANRPQVITGLLVNGPYVSVPKSYRDNLRATVHGLTRVEGASARAKAVASIKGKIRYVQEFNPGVAKRLNAQLDSRLAAA